MPSLITSLFLFCALLMTLANQAFSQSVYDFSFPSIDGGTLSLANYAGKPLLIVNTASECGFTGQYDGLQALYDEFGEAGLVVIGLPSNDFGKQEKGTAEEIKSFCEVNFNKDGQLADWFATTTAPDNEKIISAIRSVL